MIGMSFASFLTLLIVGFVAAFVMHVVLGYNVLNGIDGFASKWIAGWFGAWIGSPVLGHWSISVGNVYIIPALVAAFAAAFGATAILKASARATSSALASRQNTAAMPQGNATQLEMRKAS